MKKKFIKIGIPIIGIIFISTFLTSCSYKYVSKILVEQDIVFSKKRIEIHYNCFDNKRPSALSYLRQSVVKEIDKQGNVKYKVYDMLQLYSTSFKVDDKIFLLVDDTIFALEVKNIEYEYTKNITEETEEIMNVDSTLETVVTGYSENNAKITRYAYEWSGEMVNKIKTAKWVAVRYYAGPSMITAEISPNALEKLKELIEMK